MRPLSFCCLTIALGGVQYIKQKEFMMSEIAFIVFSVWAMVINLGTFVSFIAVAAARAEHATTFLKIVSLFCLVIIMASGLTFQFIAIFAFVRLVGS